MFHPIITGASPAGVIAGFFILFLGVIGGMIVYRAGIARGSPAPKLAIGTGVIAAAAALVVVIAS